MMSKPAEMPTSAGKLARFTDFYPFYLQEHRKPSCRALHYIGSTLVLLILLSALLSQQWALLWWMPLAGYGFAWVGHFFIEHNKPATFRYPLYSLAADWVMLWHFASGQLAVRLAQAEQSAADRSDPKSR